MENEVTEDYEAAAIRHYENAKFLRENGDIDNAGHLVGFAAECAIKFRIVSLQPGSSAPHIHLPDLLITARKKFHGRGLGTNIYHIVKDDHFRTWDVSRRYWATKSTAETELEEWFIVTRRLLGAAGVRGGK